MYSIINLDFKPGRFRTYEYCQYRTNRLAAGLLGGLSSNETFGDGDD
jgi:hypothetical protein